MSWNIYQHDWAVTLLSSHAARSSSGNRERLRHAYLFTGPEGVGRQTLAVQFAQALNCSDPPDDAGFCGGCRDCRQMGSLTHPDLSLLVPDEGHKDIRIDQVRELQRTLSLSPYAGSYRVALLADFHCATPQAANALLKTLEEPPDRVVLLLTANTPEALLPTIVSRCEVIRLRPTSIASTQAYLETEKEVSADKASLLAHLSGGRIGAAVNLVEDPDALITRRGHLADLFRLLPAARHERFKLAELIAKPRAQARQKLNNVLLIWLSFWRDVFFRATGETLPLLNVDVEVQINQVAAQVTPEQARALIISHEEAFHQMALNANIQLLAETLLLQWPQVQVFQDLGAYEEMEN